jgi:hypothetical protein
MARPFISDLLTQEYFSSYFFCRDKKSKQRKTLRNKKTRSAYAASRVRLRSTVFVAILRAFGAVYFYFFATEIASNKIKIGQISELWSKPINPAREG